MSKGKTVSDERGLGTSEGLQRARPLSVKFDGEFNISFYKVRGHSVAICTDPVTHFEIYQEWSKDGYTSRPDGPAFVECTRSTGRPTIMEWYKRAKPHRVDGPAVVRFDTLRSTRTPAYEEWFTDGALHRANGPAVIARDIDPEGIRPERIRITRAEWWWHGKRVTQTQLRRLAGGEKARPTAHARPKAQAKLTL